jgi:hypothetical protein
VAAAAPRATSLVVILWLLLKGQRPPAMAFATVGWWFGAAYGAWSTLKGQH